MAPAAPFRLKLLGGFEARRLDGSVLGVSAKKSRALLAYLALTPGRIHRRGKLADLLWSDRGDKQARDSLRQALAELRGALAEARPAALATDRDLVSLAPAAVEADALRFAELAGRDNAEDLRRAAALYEGDLLDGLDVRAAAFEDWLTPERQRYRELLASILRRLLAHETGATAIVVAQRMLVLDPLGEDGHRALMRLYAAGGDVVAALRQYDTCRALLRRELDVAPSAETESLHRQIRDQSNTQPESDRAALPATDRPRPSIASKSKPSVAVLPFRNLSDDPEQQYFSEGITEDIVIELSRFHSLFVIARNSSFLFRDKRADVRQIGRDLDVDYIVEGSVRRVESRLRVTAQLIESATGSRLWAERYDRDVQDLFEVQDEVVQSIVAMLPGVIEEAGARSSRHKRPDSLAGYDFLLRGVALARTFDDADTEAARKLLEAAVAADATLARAYAWLAILRLRDWWHCRSAPSLGEAFALGRKAVVTDENDGYCHGILGMVYLERRGFDEASFHIERFVALNPNDPAAAVLRGDLLAYLGRAQEGVTSIERAFRLNPLAPQAYNSFYGMILFAARRYADSAAPFGRILVEPQIGWDFMYPVACCGYLDRAEEAHKLTTIWRALRPAIPLLAFAAKEPFKHPADLEHLLEGLRRTGLSD